VRPSGPRSALPQRHRDQNIHSLGVPIASVTRNLGYDPQLHPLPGRPSGPCHTKSSYTIASGLPRLAAEAEPPASRFSNGPSMKDMSNRGPSTLPRPPSKRPAVRFNSQNQAPSLDRGSALAGRKVASAKIPEGNLGGRDRPPAPATSFFRQPKPGLAYSNVEKSPFCARNYDYQGQNSAGTDRDGAPSRTVPGEGMTKEGSPGPRSTLYRGFNNSTPLKPPDGLFNPPVQEPAKTKRDTPPTGRFLVLFICSRRSDSDF